MCDRAILVTEGDITHGYSEKIVDRCRCFNNVKKFDVSGPETRTYVDPTYILYHEESINSGGANIGTKTTPGYTIT